MIRSNVGESDHHSAGSAPMHSTPGWRENMVMNEASPVIWDAARAFR
jgi:hypothetical protein